MSILDSPSPFSLYFLGGGRFEAAERKGEENVGQGILLMRTGAPRTRTRIGRSLALTLLKYLLTHYR